MKRCCLILMLLLLTASPVLSNEPAQLDAPLRALAAGIVPAPLLDVEGFLGVVSDGRGNRLVNVLVLFDPSQDEWNAREELSYLAPLVGTAVRAAAGVIVSAQIGLDDIELLASLPGVRYVEMARPLRPLLDVTVPLIGGDVMHDLSPTPYRGQNVVVGVVDTGVDWTHGDFIDPSTGNSRLAFLWDQTLQPGVDDHRPAEYRYGVEYTGEQITAELQGETTGFIREHDQVGHGTHVMGTAAGNGYGTGNGYPPFRYIGVAPEATLVAVKTGMLSNSIIDGVDYVFRRADELGLPAVVNLSLGSHFGPHDGTSALEMGLDALIGNGKIIVAAAGNENANNWHGEVQAAPGVVGRFTFTVPAHAAHPIMPDVIALNGWYPGEQRYTIRVTAPDGRSFDTQRGAGWMQDDVMALVENGLLNGDRPYEYNGLRQCLVALVGNPLTHFGEATVPAGKWTIEFIANESNAGAGEIDLWVVNAVLGGAIGGIGFEEGNDPGEIVGMPATAYRILAVGAFYSRLEWTNQFGDPYAYPSGPVLGDIAYFSSTGPSRDGRFKPELAAPGYGVAAALAPDCDILNEGYENHVVEDGVHIVLQGTSMAAPHATGAVALMLQDTPNASPEEIHERLKYGAAREEFTGYEIPNTTWGWGKLNVLNAYRWDADGDGYGRDADCNDGDPTVWDDCDDDAADDDTDNNAADDDVATDAGDDNDEGCGC